MAYRPEVIADSSGKWCSNGLVFATKQESDSYVDDLRWRWTAVTDTRSSWVDDPATYRWITGRGAERIAP